MIIKLTEEERKKARLFLYELSKYKVDPEGFLEKVKSYDDLCLHGALSVIDSEVLGKKGCAVSSAQVLGETMTAIVEEFGELKPDDQQLVH